MTNIPTAEAYHQQLAALLAEMPVLTDFDKDWNLPDGTIHWLGRVSAIVKEAVPHELLPTQLDMAIDHLIKTLSPSQNARTIFLLVHRALAKLEIRLPTSAQGAFVNVGSGFDAISAFAKVLTAAKSDVLIVDPYMDEKALTEFAVLVQEGVPVRMLTDEASMKASVEPMARRWISQHANSRPLALRATPPKTLHDRLLLIDGTEAWILTQSLKDFAQRSPASLQRTDRETAALKIDAYAAIWAGASEICAS